MFSFSVGFFVFLVSYAISMGCTFFIRRIAVRVGFVDHPGGRKKHVGDVPLGGGIAIFLGAVLPVVICAVLSLTDSRYLPADIADYANKLPNVIWDLSILWGAALIFVVVGVFDDRYDLSPFLRLGIQVGVATAVYVCSYLAAHSEVPPADVKLAAPLFQDIPILQGLLTVLWIVGLTNAFNFLDNMDGMCAGVALMSSIVLFVVAAQTMHVLVAALLVTFMGGLVGFLLFNFPPAKIFMGDAGSTFIGFFMAVMSMGVRVFGLSAERPTTLEAVAIPVLVMMVPIYDITSVVILRIKKGLSPFRPDRQHFTHRLLALGMSRPEVLITVYMVVLAVGIAAAVLPKLQVWGQIAVIFQAATILSLVALLENAGRRQKGEGG